MSHRAIEKRLPVYMSPHFARNIRFSYSEYLNCAINKDVLLFYRSIHLINHIKFAPKQLHQKLWPEISIHLHTVNSLVFRVLSRGHANDETRTLHPKSKWTTKSFTWRAQLIFCPIFMANRTRRRRKEIQMCTNWRGSWQSGVFLG